MRLRIFHTSLLRSPYLINTLAPGAAMGKFSVVFHFILTAHAWYVGEEGATIFPFFPCDRWVSWDLKKLSAPWSHTSSKHMWHQTPLQRVAQHLLFSSLVRSTQTGEGAAMPWLPTFFVRHENQVKDLSSELYTQVEGQSYSYKAPWKDNDLPGPLPTLLPPDTGRRKLHGHAVPLRQIWDAKEVLKQVE